MEPKGRIELPTYPLRRGCSTNWATLAIGAVSENLSLHEQYTFLVHSEQIPRVQQKGLRFSLARHEGVSLWSRQWESDSRSLSYQDSALPLSYDGVALIVLYFDIIFKQKNATEVAIIKWMID